MPYSRRSVSSRKHLLIALLAFSSLTSGERAFAGSALPSGGEFAAGAGSIAASANAVNVSQSTARGVINWQSFSIGQGNTVNIANGAGATLNRVTGGDVSSIAGSLTSTGSIYVINQAGVLVTPTGKINTNGTFVASTRDVADSSFMAGGAQTFAGTSAGTVVNQGSITSSNGDVILIGKSVQNSGQISAANGKATLAASDNVVLQPAGADNQILIGTGSGDVTNSGTIDAAQAELNAAGGNVYALASNNGGIIRASGTTIKDGHVYLTAGDDVNVGGAVTATNADGSGGTINVTGGATTGNANISGAVTANATGAAKGGKIVATASNVSIAATAKINANGGTDGGTVLLGGDRHGGTDPSVALSSTPIANAKNTTVAAGAQISANAGAKGNGGNVVVWSDQFTSFAGSISAQGGSIAGNGGFVEVSGAQQLGFTGAVTTAAVNGASGTLLLDPEDVTIVSSTDPGGITTTSPGVTNASGTFTSTAGTSYILNTDIDAALASNNVVISTGSLGDGLSGKGDIHFGTNNGGPNVHAAPIYWSSSNSLTLNALGLIDTPGGNPSTATGGYDPSSPGTLVHSIGGGAITFSASANGAVQTAQTVISITGDIVGSGGLMSFISTSPTYRIEVGNHTTVSNSTALGAGTIVFQADQVRFGTGTGPVGVISTLNGELDIRPTSAGAINVGDIDPTGAYANNSNTSLIRSEDIVNAAANLVVIGGTTTTTLTIKNVNPAGELSNGGYAAFDATNANNLKFLTGTSGSVVQDVNMPIIVNDPNFTLFFGTGGLAVETGGAITLNSLYNSVGTIAFKQTGVGGDIGFIRQADTPSSDGAGGNGTGLIIGTVGNVSGITTVGTSTVTLTANETVADPNAFTPGTLGPLAITQASGSANAITTTNLVVQGPTSSFTLDNPANAVSKVAAASVGSLTLYDNINLHIGTVGAASGITGTGNIVLVDNGTLTIDSGAPITTTGGNVRIEDGSPNTTFSSPGTLNTGFVNNDGTAAFNVTGGGNWRVYSQDPRSDNDGGLTTYDFVQYAATNSYATPFATADAALNGSATGNGFLYTVAPTITQSLTGTFNRIYNGTSTISPGLTSSNYSTASGAINSDTLVLNNPTAAGTISYNSIHTGASVTGVPTISITSATDHAGATIYGYGTNFSSNVTGTITALPIIISGARLYDGTNNADVTGAGISITNVQAADTGSAPTISGTGTGALNGIHVGSQGVGSFTNYALGNNPNGDYTLVGATGSVTISAAPLTITGEKTYTGTSGFVAGQLTIASGAVAGDTVTIAAGSTGTAKTGGSPVSDQGTYASSAVSATVTVTGLGNASDYSVPVTGTLKIDPIQLTVSGTKIYDAATNADANTFSTPFAGELSADVTAGNVTLTGSGTLTGTNAPNVGSYSTTATPTPTFALNTLALSLTGAQAGKGNYVLSGATYTVTPATITAIANGGRTYDGLTSVLAASITSVTGLQNGDTLNGSGATGLTITGVGSTGSANAGTYNGVNHGGTGSSLFSIGSLALNGTDAHNYTLEAGTYVITPAALTVTASGQSKVYGTTTGTLLTGSQTTDFTTSALPNSESVGSVTLTATPSALLATTDAGTTGLTMTPSAASGSGTFLASNYNITYNTGAITITPAQLTASGTKAYDGTVNFASSTSGQLVVAGGVNGQTVTLSGGGTATSSSANANSYTSTTFTPNGFTVTGGTGNDLTSNYQLPSTAALTITPAALTVTASGQSKVYGTTTGTLLTGSQTTDFTTSALPNSESVGSVTLTATPSALLATTDAGTTGLTMTPSAASGSGTFLASNYNITYNTGAITITPAQLTASGTKAYDGTVNFASSTSGQLVVAGGVNGQTVTLSGGGTATSSSANANSYTSTTFTPNGFTVTGGTGNDLTSNYQLPSTAALTITPAALTVTASGQSKVYGTTTGTLLTGSQTTDFTTSALPNSESVGSVTLTATPSALLATTDAGTTGLTMTPSAASGSGTFLASNYNITYNTGAITITPAQLTASGTKAYDGTVNFASSTSGQLVVAGGVNGQTVTLSGGGTATSSSANANSYTSTTFTPNGFTVTGGTGNDLTSNYQLPSTAALTITPAALTVTASGQSKVYGTTTGTLLTGSQTTDFTTSALPNSESVGSVTLTATPSALLATTDAGTTGLTMTPSAASGSGTFLASNYNITYNTGAITITPAQLTASGTKAYDGTVNFASSTSGQLVVAGGVNGQTVTLSGGGTATSSSANANSYTSTTFTPNGFTVTGGTGNDLTSNYQLPSTAALTITPAALTVTASGQSKVYGTTTGTLLTGSQTTDFTTSALPNSESVGSVTLTATPSALLATTDAGTTGLTMTPSAASGSGTFLASNYNITYNTGAITITPAQLTASGTKAYDGTVNFASSTSGQLVVAGGVNGQTVTLSGGGTATSSSANANSYTSTTFTPNGFTVTGGTGNDLTSNYQLPSTAALTITPAALTVTASGQSKVYGTTTGTLLTGSQTTDFTTSALPNSESVGSVTLTATPSALLATTDAGTTGLTMTPSAASGSGTFLASNYNITYNTGAITITPAQLTASGTKAYDGTVNFASSTSGQLVVAGGVNGQTVTLSGGGTATSSSANANSYTSTTFTPNGFTVTGGTGNDLTSNYQLPSTAALTITPAALTVTPKAVSVFYDGSTLNNGTYSDTLSNYTIGGLQNGETTTSAGIALTGSMAFSGSTTTAVRNATTYSQAVGTLGLTSTNGNYALSFTNPIPNNYVITPVVLFVSGTKTYDGAATAPSADIGTFSGLKSTDSFATGGGLTLTGTGTTSSANAAIYSGEGGATLFGAGSLALTGSNASNYTLVPGTFTITPALLTVTGTKVYSGTTGFVTTQLAVTGGVNGETVTLTGGSGTSSSPNVGSYAGSSLTGLTDSVTGGNALASNYQLPTTGTLSITPLGVTVTGTRVYNGTPNAPGTILTVVGEIPGDPTLTVTGTGTLQSPNVNPADPITGLGTLALTGTGVGNYVLNGGTVAITPAALTITANNQTKTYGSTLTFVGTEFVPVGLQGTETVGRVTLVSAGTPATAAVAGSPYAITPSAATGGTFVASNYTITYVAGALRINPLPVTVSGTRPFDSTSNAQASILTVFGELPGDPVLTLSGTGTLAGPNASLTPTQITSLGSLTLTGAGSTNYVLASGTVLITSTNQVAIPQVIVPNQTAAGAGVQSDGVYTDGILLPQEQQNGIVGGTFATGAGCEDGNTECNVPTTGAAAAESTGGSSGVELISGKDKGNGG